MTISLVKQSDLITDVGLDQIAQACDRQLQHEVAAAWGIKDPQKVITGPDPTAYQFFFVDEIPEAPGALAYHYVDPDTGVPAGKIGVKVSRDAGESVSSATSHEAIELQCDIFCASWSYSNRLRSLVATEACDPVQSQTYTVDVQGTPVEVSNFVTPWYFSREGPGPPPGPPQRPHRNLRDRTWGLPDTHEGRRRAQRLRRRISAELRRAKEASRGRTYWRHVTMALAMNP